MTIKEILTAWDRYLPSVPYPSSWCLHYWRATFSSEEVTHALEVTRRTTDRGRLRDNNYAAYATGVMKNEHSVDEEVRALIAAHVEVKQGNDDVEP